MVDQTAEVNGKQHSNRAVGAEGNAFAISHELVRLAELQLRLFAIEGRHAARSLILMFVLAALGLATLVGASIAGLAGTALFLDAYTTLSTWGAFAVTGAAGFLLTILFGLGIAAIYRANSGRMFQHSAKALSTNVECIKSVLSRDDR